MDAPARSLAELTRRLSGAEVPPDAADTRVRGIAADTRRLRPGELFVALPGRRSDGAAFIEDAVARGAAAIVARRDVGPLRVPVVRVDDPRGALAELSAAWYGHPADRLCLVGITGSLGKTSVLSMLEAVASAADIPLGTIGSLGVRAGGDLIEPTRLTTPEPPGLHRALARIEAAGARTAAMEVTSHALDQERVRGLTFDIGIFTNLRLLEHIEYHGSFRRYAEAKRRFFDHMRAGAPVIYAAEDRAVRTLVREYRLLPIGCGAGGVVSVRVDRLLLDRGGTRVTLRVRRPLPRLDGASVAPVSVPVELRVLGRPNICNAALAAAAALCLGASPDAVRDALAAFPPPWRRMQIVHRDRFTALDDTVGHPDSISAVFEVAARIRHRRLHVVYAIRGSRGEEINRRDAETVAIWSRCVPLATLVVTSSDDETDEANRVTAGEQDAFLAELRRGRVRFEARDRLRDAIALALDRITRGDLLLLLGAQGMNAGGDWLRRLLGGADAAGHRGAAPPHG